MGIKVREFEMNSIIKNKSKISSKSKMKVQILKTQPFSNAMSLQYQSIKVIKKINKIYYCKNAKTWYLPLEDYPTFKSSLADDPEFEFEESESKTKVFIKKIADKIERKFSRFINSRSIWNLMVYAIIQQIVKSACLRNILRELKL